METHKFSIILFLRYRTAATWNLYLPWLDEMLWAYLAAVSEPDAVFIFRQRNIENCRRDVG